MGETIIVDFSVEVDVEKVKKYLKKSKFPIEDLKVVGRSIFFKSKNTGKNVVDVMHSLKPLKDHILNIDIKKQGLEEILMHLLEKK